MTTAPANAFPDRSETQHSSPGDADTDRGQKSLSKVFPHAAHAEKLSQPFDPWRFKAVFPDRWSAFLRANYRDAEHVAVEYGVRFQTALNWWQGLNKPSGNAVAQATLTHTDSFKQHMLARDAA